MGLICASLPALNILVTRHVTPDKPNERRYMFSEILRHPRGMNHVLGLSAESEKSTVAEERRGDNEREVEASDVGLESVITEYRWIGPYVSRAERLESDASTLRENVNS
jgi:cation transport regulator ChaB